MATLAEEVLDGLRVLTDQKMEHSGGVKIGHNADHIHAWIDSKFYKANASEKRITEVQTRMFELGWECLHKDAPFHFKHRVSN